LIVIDGLPQGCRKPKGSHRGLREAEPAVLQVLPAQALAGDLMRVVRRTQSSSASRETAAHAGFFDLIQCGERPERYPSLAAPE
jgi:hypothetical protein